MIAFRSAVILLGCLVVAGCIFLVVHLFGKQPQDQVSSVSDPPVLSSSDQLESVTTEDSSSVPPSSEEPEPSSQDTSSSSSSTDYSVFDNTVFVGNSVIDESVIEEKILKSELDLGIVEGQVKHPDLLVVPMMEDELVLVCGPQHPFAKKKTIKAADLSGQDFILRERGSGTREFFEQFLSQASVQIEEKWVCHSSAAIKNAVMGGQGMTVISRRLVKRESTQKKLYILPLQDRTLTRTFRLIYHKDKFLSVPFSAFIGQCRSAV